MPVLKDEEKALLTNLASQLELPYEILASSIFRLNFSKEDPASHQELRTIVFNLFFLFAHGFPFKWVLSINTVKEMPVQSVAAFIINMLKYLIDPTFFFNKSKIDVTTFKQHNYLIISNNERPGDIVHSKKNKDILFDYCQTTAKNMENGTPLPLVSLFKKNPTKPSNVNNIYEYLAHYDPSVLVTPKIIVKVPPTLEKPKIPSPDKQPETRCISFFSLRKRPKSADSSRTHTAAGPAHQKEKDHVYKQKK